MKEESKLRALRATANRTGLKCAALVMNRDGGVTSGTPLGARLHVERPGAKML